MGGHSRPYRGVSDEWMTPPEIVEALGPFDDDPAQPGCRDGLLREWRGMVFLNPPYGPQTGQWLQRLALHGSGIALVFARTETQWFQVVWEEATAIFFLAGRLHFYRDGVRAKHNSGAPSVLIAYGQEASARLSRCSWPGKYIELNRCEALRREA